ncbi:MAG: hypothetical protein U0S50_02895 [Sphingopyxis sp.]|uniref:hypothetical protein n=1 Tax=Sphingopyxis sp. TaxID=1908224 RepID=UPI002ABA746D|nr:hypothetical protein [Sphingopyxis sp.]MDZ3830750.1 hypothetical protein [Sphingopyxis sp.]
MTGSRNGWCGTAAALLLVAVAPVAAADAGAGAATDEGDKMFLDMAQQACQAADFPSLLWPFANSAAVRARYSAASVRHGVAGSSQVESAAAYAKRDAFPIVMIDFSYVTRDSMRRFEAADGDPDQLVPVQIEFNGSSDNRYRVDWLPGRFEPGEGDGPGTLIAATGPGGYLLFRPTRDCWELVEDIRNPG